MWLGDINISVLLYADDIVLIADSHNNLPEMLNVCFHYSVKWSFEFNVNKCEAVIFGLKHKKWKQQTQFKL